MRPGCTACFELESSTFEDCIFCIGKRCFCDHREVLENMDLCRIRSRNRKRRGIEAFLI